VAHTPPACSCFIAGTCYFPPAVCNNLCTLFTGRYPRNVGAEWATILLRIREVNGLYLGPETAYNDWGFSMFWHMSREVFKLATWLKRSDLTAELMAFKCRRVFPVLIGEQRTSCRIGLLQFRSSKIRKVGLTDVDDLSITRSSRPVHTN
jgi:hypothetical protein